MENFYWFYNNKICDNRDSNQIYIIFFVILDNKGWRVRAPGGQDKGPGLWFLSLG
jgi:hypothetical protein